MCDKSNTEAEMGKWMYIVETEVLVNIVNKGDKMQI